MAQSTAPTPTDPTLQQPTQPDVPMVVKSKGHLASNIIGKSVLNSSGEDAENIGKVSDIVISPDDDLQAVVIGVGGFLGIGSKDVAIEYDLVDWQELEGNRYMVVETSADALKALPDFDPRAFEPMPADAAVSEPKPATADDVTKAEETVAAEKAAAEAERQERTVPQEQQETPVQ
ncbi:PRC-barrel domain-containing protein [Mesorhizobium xinjiangense]|uniref:PRC-barrel domain-containing protein n=1 Tax=Mesorhizobium xinjiangense TaxID=2678685 RepID=UPI001F4507D0|nr:PRC-barrel domain-containing protein [Mesorhizobium xinjiangense]